MYSEDQPADGPYSTAIANWRKSLLKGLTPFITGDGEQRRDMIHVNDVVSANIHCMNYNAGFTGDIFDVGTGDNISLNEVKDLVQKYHAVEFDYVAPRPGEVATTQANVTPLQNHGWTASTNIIAGIEKCFDFEVAE